MFQDIADKRAKIEESSVPFGFVGGQAYVGPEKPEGLRWSSVPFGIGAGEAPAWQNWSSGFGGWSHQYLSASEVVRPVRVNVNLDAELSLQCLSAPDVVRPKPWSK